MAKPKPKNPKKCVSINLDDTTEAIIMRRAMDQYRGNFSEAARQIVQEWDWWKGYIAANQTPPPPAQ
jgi:hypothetical protein